MADRVSVVVAGEEYVPESLLQEASAKIERLLALEDGDWRARHADVSHRLEEANAELTRWRQAFAEQGAEIRRLTEALDAGETVEPAPVEDPASLQLFGRADYAEQRDVSEREPEHTALPQAVIRERDPSLTLSFDSPEDRDRLIGILEVRPTRGASAVWPCAWPPGGPEDDLTLDLEGGV